MALTAQAKPRIGDGFYRRLGARHASQRVKVHFQIPSADGSVRNGFVLAPSYERALEVIRDHHGGQPITLSASAAGAM